MATNTLARFNEVCREVYSQPPAAYRHAAPDGSVSWSHATKEVWTSEEDDMNPETNERNYHVARLTEGMPLPDAIKLHRDAIKRLTKQAKREAKVKAQADAASKRRLDDILIARQALRVAAGRGNLDAAKHILDNAHTYYRSHMAASNINRVVLTGNLTRDPELRTTQGGMSICSLRVASNSRAKDQSGEWVDKPSYFNVTVFGSQGENVAKFLEKGRPVAIDGRLQWREWEKDGVHREAVEIVADSVQFLSSGDGAGRSEPDTSTEPEF